METQNSRKLTYEDYVAIPEDHLRHEIIGGEHYVTPSPATRHQRVSLEIAYLLRSYVENRPLGQVFAAPFDVLLSDFDIVVPDLMFISTERSRFLTEKNMQGPPDLVVEILSPSTRKRDLRLKRDLYERAGVQEYWIVDPDRNEVTTYRRGDEGYPLPQRLSRAAADVLTTPLLPGLEIPLTRLLA